MKLLFVFLIGLSFISCVDLEKSGQLEQIDAMIQSLDSIDVVYKEHKMDSLNIMAQNAYGVENRIKNYYVADTINLALGRKMDAFKIMRKSIAPLGKAMTAIESSISEEREALDQLKNDIDGSNGEREKYDEHILFEQAKVSQLRALITDYVSTKLSAEKTYEMYFDDLNAFSMGLLPKRE